MDWLVEAVMLIDDGVEPRVLVKVQHRSFSTLYPYTNRFANAATNASRDSNFN